MDLIVEKLGFKNVLICLLSFIKIVNIKVRVFLIKKFKNICYVLVYICIYKFVCYKFRKVCYRLLGVGNK